MKLGIDFGTTHTVVAIADRGNYPSVAFEWGESFPSLIAVRRRDGAVCCGAAAAEVADDPGHELLRSFKRRVQEAGPLTEVEVGGWRFRVADLLARFFEALRRALVEQSNAGLDDDEPFVAAVSVPANAGSDQRFLTLDAFRRAGFEVEALLNEPSAAGFEYADRFRRTVTSRREQVLVYDLGGGTFDASLISMAGLANEVLASAGVQRLGGDDFDAAILADLERRHGLAPESERQRAALAERVREQKEALLPQSRRFVLDLAAFGRPALAVPIEEIYEACRPLVERTLAAVDELFSATTGQEGRRFEAADLAGVYVVGGASAFPPIARALRERFGASRVRRSLHPHAAAAIGLACFLDERAGFTLSERLHHTFGVFREAEGGHEVVFDPIFPRGTLLPEAGEPPLVAIRRYRPMHDLGHFRYVEASELVDGRPDGHLAPWDEVRFPFARALREADDLDRHAVTRLAFPGPEFEERYSCSAAGTFEVTLTCLDDGFARTYRSARAARR